MVGSNGGLGDGRRRLPRRKSRVGWLNLLAIGAGGVVGTVARVELSRALVGGGLISWGTFVANVAGSFALGFISTLLVERFGPTRYLAPLLMTGFCGSFTTLSTFALEVDLHVRHGSGGEIVSGVLYGAITLAAGIVAVIGGIALARGTGRFHRRRRAERVL